MSNVLMKMTRRAVPAPVVREVRRRTPAEQYERILWQLSRDERDCQPRGHARRAHARASYAGLLGAEPGWVLRRNGGRLLACGLLEHADLTAVTQANLDLVVDVCEELGLDYFVVPQPDPDAVRVGMAIEAREQLLAGLCHRYVGRAVYVGAVGAGMPACLVGRPRSPQVQSASVLRIFRPVTDPTGRLLVAGSHACQVEFWTSDRSGGIHAPRPNPVAAVLPPEEQVSARTRFRSRTYATLRPFTRPVVGEVTFPVDVVYTWVDGKDPAWLARKNAVLAVRGLSGAGGTGAAAELNEQAANASRYLSRDELRYSLRSLEMHAPWVRHVFLVTDDQIPAWLDRASPRLTVVSHREIFGTSGVLPTFNSHAIESRLHHITGLSEHYVYLNDDVFFARTVRPSTFFHANGLAKFFLSKAQVELGPVTWADPPVLSAAKNNRALLEQAFGTTLVQKFKHAPHPQRRSVLAEMELRFPDDFKRTAASQFRSPDDISIPSALHHYYAYLTGRATPGDIRYDYADLASETTPSRLRRWLRHRNYDVFCLNDTTSDGQGLTDRLRLLTEFLDAYFPLPSSFEIVQGARGCVGQSGLGTSPTRPTSSPSAFVTTA